MTKASSGASRYRALIEKIFFDAYSEGATEVAFERAALEQAAEALGIDLPKNLGDVVYSFRYRSPLPASILETRPEGKEWAIIGAGHGRYVFKLVSVVRVEPNDGLIATKLPDSTPEIVSAHALSDEQALLAKVRYNRLIDIFLGICTYSLQSHLRTTVGDVGQIEIDEVYVGIDRRGRQFVVPVQAKGGSDRLSVVQTRQDILCCAEKFPSLVCRPVSTQFMSDDRIAMFELSMEKNEIGIADERHYSLVPADFVTSEDLRSYSRRS